MRCESGKMYSLEGLARWIDPERGTLSPADFIPILEKYHQLHRLGIYMIEEMCREIPSRIAEGLPLIPVSINFAGQDFDSPTLVEEVIEILDRYGVDHNLLVVEVTEQALPKASAQFKEQIDAFRKNGFKVWVDDFGSGYSSLHVFSEYRFDVLKLDMDFLRNWDDVAGVNKALLAAIVDTAHRLGIQTLAEGMETAEQLSFLREIGCDLAQGYYFHKPESMGAIKFRNQNSGRIAPCEDREETEVFARRYAETDYWKT